jgi:hypothetical protein
MYCEGLLAFKPGTGGHGHRDAVFVSGFSADKGFMRRMRQFEEARDSRSLVGLHKTLVSL